eukprot:6485610-Amphidinium_carterae.1
MSCLCLPRVAIACRLAFSRPSCSSRQNVARYASSRIRQSSDGGRESAFPCFMEKQQMNWPVERHITFVLEVCCEYFTCSSLDYL